MKFIFAIIPFVNLATNEFVGGATHALNKFVIATPIQGSCHDNFCGAPTKCVIKQTPTVDDGTPLNRRVKLKEETESRFKALEQKLEQKMAGLLKEAK